MMVRLIQIDGTLPNLALMRISEYHKGKGDLVDFTRRPGRGLFDGSPDRVYASTIFRFSEEKIQEARRDWPNLIIGGTGVSIDRKVEEFLPGVNETSPMDYDLYPEFKSSIGFSQRGCRLKCGFCVVPKKEGKNRAAASVKDLWRGEGHPKEIMLLDNDLFGQPEWRQVIKDLDGFKVNINQGFNVRLIDDEAAVAIAGLNYYDAAFKKRAIHTAWDNYGQDKIFFQGIERLTKAGVPAKRIRVYMLIGYDPVETWERIFDRLNRITAAGMTPYPMVYAQTRRDLKRFQRWIVRRYNTIVSWEDFKRGESGKLWEIIDGGMPAT